MMEKANVVAVDDNIILLKQLTEILTNSYDIDVMAGRIEKIHSFLNNRDVVNSYSQSIDTVICEHLNEIGMPPSLKGYRYIITAVKEVLEDETVLEGVTKILYPSVAKKHNSTSQRVEKAIRHSIEVAWSRNDASKLKEEFKYATTGGRTRPTNSEFIATLCQHIKMSW